MLNFYSVSPGRMDTLAVAMACLGGAKSVVDAGVWLSPFVIECTEEDSEVLYDLLKSEMEKVNDPEVSALSIKKVG